MLMHCSNPGAITDEELLVSLDNGVLRPEVQEHISHCPSCAQKLHTYASMNRQLFRQFYRWNCPPSQILGEYEMGELPAEQSYSVASHIQSCARCTEDVALFTTFMATDLQPQAAPVQRPTLYDVGQSIGETVRRAAETATSYIDAGIESGRRIIRAVLVPSNPALLMQRGTQQVDAWPRSYVAQDLTISLHLEQDQKYRQEVQLIGLVMRDGDVHTLEGTTVQLLQQLPSTDESPQVKLVDAQTIDELGNFIFSSLEPALYTLEIHDADTTVLIEQISIEQQA
jgi:hypothetical protein